MTTLAGQASPATLRSSPSAADDRRVVFFVFVTVFLDMIGFGIVIPLLPFYVQAMGGSAQTVGLILGSFSLTQLIATPILGRLSDRYGRRPVILLSLAGNSLAMLVFALATDLTLLPLLFASRIFAGATAGNLSACQAAVADVTEGAERARGMGRVGAGVGLGMVLGPVVASLLIPLGAWAPPLGAALLAFGDLVGVFFLMPETHRRRGASPAPSKPAGAAASDLWSVIRERRVLVVLVLYFLAFLCLTNIQTALALLAHERLGWGAVTVGRVFGLFGLVSLVVQGGLIGRMARGLGRANVLVLGAACAMGGLATIAAAGGAATLLAGVVAFAFGVGSTLPLLASLASDYAGSERQGALLGIAQSAGGLARTVGPVWAGLLFARFGAAAPFWGGTLTAAIWLAFCLGLRRGR